MTGRSGGATSGGSPASEAEAQPAASTICPAVILRAVGEFGPGRAVPAEVSSFVAACGRCSAARLSQAASRALVSRLGSIEASSVDQQPAADRRAEHRLGPAALPGR